MVQLHVMEKQFFKQLLQKLDLRFNKDTTSHMSFTMWHELQGWVTSVIVKLKCSAVTLYLCHRCGATVKLYCCCTQAGSVWPVTAANWEIWFLHLLNAAATSCRHTEAFSVFTDIFTAYFAYIAHPSCACCMWPALHRAIHQLVGRRWHLLSCHDCVWLCDPHKVIMCLTFSRSDLPSKAPSVNGTIYTTFNKQTFTHAVSCCCALNWRALQIWLNPSTLGRFYFLHNRSQPPSELGTSSPSREQSAV